MASIVNKRQQARNERTLQDLIKNVPGNDRCADCFVRNPGMIFLHNNQVSHAYQCARLGQLECTMTLCTGLPFVPPRLKLTLIQI